MQIDINEVLGKSLAELTSKALGRIQRTVKDNVEELQAQFRSQYAGYLEGATNQYIQVKTILSRSAPRPLYSFYVPLGVTCRGRGNIIDVDAIKLCGTSTFSVVVGTGGSGKTTLMRHLLITAASTTDYVPVFVQLKSCNGAGSCNLMRLILDELSRFGLQLSESSLESALKSGLFFLILDGYDEVDNDKKKAVREQILLLADRFPENAIVVSSRPQDFLVWTKFVEWSIMPLELTQAADMIAKIGYDTDTTQLLLRDLHEGDLKSHVASFIRTPLLLTILLITYQSTGGGTLKRNVFYQQVFETFWNQHDALKEGYKRQRFTAIDMDDFTRVLACVCFQGYWEGVQSFERSTLRAYVERAFQASGVTEDRDAFIEDLELAVCVLAKEGHRYEFIHPTFQEYYTAHYISQLEQEKRIKVAEHLVANASRDGVLSFLLEIRREIAEEDFIVPVLKEMASRLAPANLEDSDWLLSVMDTCAKEVVFAKADGKLMGFIPDDQNVPVARFVVRNYDRHGKLRKRPLLDGEFLKELATQGSKQERERAEARERAETRASQFSLSTIPAADFDRRDEIVVDVARASWLPASIEYAMNVYERIVTLSRKRAKSIDDILFG